MGAVGGENQTMKRKEFGVFCPHCKNAIRITLDLLDYSLAFDISKYKGIPKLEEQREAEVTP